MFNLRRFVSISSKSSASKLASLNKLSKYSTQTQTNQKPLVLISDNCVKVVNFCTISENQADLIESVVSFLKRLKELKSIDSNKRLRVLVDSGGCSGFEYKFSLDTEIKPDDV